MTEKKPASVGPLHDSEKASIAAMAAALTPVWFKLPQAFWKEVAELCVKTGMKPEKLIHHGIKLCRKEMEERLQLSSKLRDGEWINAAYWRSMTPEQRSDKARRAALARWRKDPDRGSASGNRASS